MNSTVAGDPAAPESGTPAALPDPRANDIAGLAHELRNLIAPLRYAIAALEKPDRTPAQQHNALSIMKRQSAQMSRLLDDLLDVTRFGHGELKLQKSAVELAVVLGGAIEAVRPLLDRKQHSLSMQLPEQPLRIWADPTRLLQVFSNVLINAAKYTDAGGRILLSARQEQGQVIVTVRDSGIGISPDLMPRIFTLFAQGAASEGRSEGGLGIGLALVHSIVTLHEGTVEAFSEGLGKGSEFRISIPLGAVPERELSAPSAVPTSNSSGLRVLVVEDNKDVADTCAMLIELSGHQVHVAYTAGDGLDKAVQQRPDVIITDIGLPDQDGYAFARRIRSTDWGARSALVAVTGWSAEQAASEADVRLFDHFLTKPIDPDDIEALLRAIASAS